MKKTSQIPVIALAALALWGTTSTHAADPVITDPKVTSIGIVTGGDPGEGLDLQGQFVYAFGVGADAALDVKIGDAVFKGQQVGDEVPGATLEAGNRNPNWYVVDYGDSQADDDLELATTSIRWSQAGSAIPAITLTLENLEPGVEYKFQMMFGEECCNRGFDIFFDDALILKDFNPGVVHEGISLGTQEALVTHLYTPKAKTIVLRFDGTEASGDYSDHNAILNAITVEKLPPAVDTDKDGIPDPWETNNGFNPNDAADAKLDPDGDGCDNLCEYKAGTDPNDKTPPVLISAASQATVDTVILNFSEDMDPVIAADISHYTISPNLAVLSAAFPRGNQVVLTTAVQVSGGTPYTVTVTGLRDMSKNVIAPASSALFFSSVNTKDKVKSYPGLIRGGATFTSNGGGASGKVGDYAINLTMAGGPVAVFDAGFLAAANAATAADELTVVFRQKKLDIADSSAFTLHSKTAGNNRGFHAHVPWSNQHIYFDTTGCCDGATQRIETGIDTFADYTGEPTYWTDSWHIFAFTKKGPTKTIWVDGKLFLQGESSNPLLTDHTAFYMGSGAGGTELSHAIIDDFSVYSKELTEADVVALAGGTLPTALPAGKGLLAYWDFNDIPPGGLVSGAVPAAAAKAATPIRVAINHLDGSTAWDTAKVGLQIDGALVAASVVKTGASVAVDYAPNPIFGSETEHTARLLYDGNMVYQWSFKIQKYGGPTLDKVGGYPALITGSGVVTADKGGATGKAGDYGIDLTMKGGPVVTYDSTFLAAANAATAKDELSVSFWQKKHDVADSSAFTLNSPSAGSNRGFHAHVPWSNQHIYFDTTGCCDGATQRIETGIDTFAGYDPADATYWTTKWHHFAFTKKGAAKNVYVDGELFLSGESTNPLLSDHNAFFMGSGANGTEMSHAIIDDFAVFGKELTAANVTALKNGTLPTALPAATGLIGYWDFNTAAVATPPALGAARGAAGKVTLTFEGTLQASDTAGGAYTDVAGTSPLTVDATAMKFYRAVRK